MSEFLTGVLVASMVWFLYWFWGEAENAKTLKNEFGIESLDKTLRTENQKKIDKRLGELSEQVIAAFAEQEVVRKNSYDHQQHDYAAEYIYVCKHHFWRVVRLAQANGFYVPRVIKNALLED